MPNEHVGSVSQPLTSPLLHSFAGAADGKQPFGVLTSSGSTLFGTTVAGGASSFGTVFKVDLACGVNQHVASQTCVACAPGSTRAAGDSTLGADTACTATACAANEHVASHACVACALGSTRPAGDLATGPDTQCVRTWGFDDPRASSSATSTRRRPR